ncbi:MAG: extracellular solute-binding protein [Peptococcaceae bacterium]|nr:extracellular solute-binding protein [Peptococcaceae bacterium]
MKRVLGILLVLTVLMAAFGCTKKEDDNKVVIYSGAEDYRNEEFRSRLKEKFPDYDIIIEEMATGTLANKLMTEGKNIQCDIVFDCDYGYASKFEPYLAELSDYDFAPFVEDMVLPSKKFIPECKNGGCIAINPDVLKDKGVEEPTSYSDLIKPEYKGLVSMPNPKSSGTGYMFLKSLIVAMGEDQAFAYMDELAKNITQFTTSGSGPVNDLVRGEAGIGLGMTAQTVTKINEGANLKIVYFDEGSPVSRYGMGMIDSRQDKAAVKAVFDYFYSDLIKADKEKFYPEKIYKDLDFSIPNYPSDIKYSDMGVNTPEEKTRILDKWIH